jgi:hypothetical protein
MGLPKHICLRRQGNRYKESGEFPPKRRWGCETATSHNFDPWPSTRLPFFEFLHWAWCLPVPLGSRCALRTPHHSTAAMAAVEPARHFVCSSMWVTRPFTRRRQRPRRARIRIQSQAWRRDRAVAARGRVRQNSPIGHRRVEVDQSVSACGERQQSAGRPVHLHPS